MTIALALFCSLATAALALVLARASVAADEADQRLARRLRTPQAWRGHCRRSAFGDDRIDP